MAQFFETLLRKKQPPPGRLIDMEGSRLHFHHTGPIDSLILKRSPTVVIEAGCGWASPMYSWLQKKLSKRVRVCTYDRAGLGWSETSSEPRDAEHIADQLHTLLNAASVKPPYLFVGHSIAGLYLRVYGGKYPHELAGMVLLDASHPRQFEIMDTSDNWTFRTRVLYQSISLCASIGITALYNPLFDPGDDIIRHLPSESIRQLCYLSRQPQTYTTGMAEFKSFETSAQQALQAGSLGDLPLVVLTGPERSNLPAGIDENKYKADWLMLQRELATLSTQGRHKVIEGAGHGTLITEKRYADQVADEILMIALS